MNSNFQRKIFLVDDDPFCLAINQQHLQNMGFQHTRSFSTGQDLLENLYHCPDLIFLDYNLEDTNGLEILKKINSFDPSIYVVLLSGQSEETVTRELLVNGAFEYIIKDENETENMTAAIAKWLSIYDNNNKYVS